MDGIEVYLKIPSQLAEIFIDDSEIDLDLNKGINDGYALIFRKGEVLGNGVNETQNDWSVINLEHEIQLHKIGTQAEKLSVELLDMKGVVLYQNNSNDRIITIPTQHLATGIYTIRLHSNHLDETKRVFVR
jgi:hypothetical protein